MLATGITKKIMTHRFSCLFLMFSGTLSAAEINSPPCPDVPGNGTVLATLLTHQYQSQAMSCNGGKHSAVWCSGVLIKPGADGRGSWTLSPAEQAMQSGAVFYLRDKLKTGEFSWGALIAPTASSGQQIRPVCAYPYAVSTETSRNDAGCGAENTRPVLSTLSDLNSCEALGVYDETTYRTKNRVCSFSTQLRTGFQTALNINKQGNQNTPVQVWVSPWPASPSVQGFVYRKTSQSGLMHARQEAAEYASATGKSLPVISFDPSSSGTFTYVPQDNVITDKSVEAVRQLNDEIDAHKHIMLSYVPPNNLTEAVYEPTDQLTIAFPTIVIPDSLKPLSNINATYGIATTRGGLRVIFHTGGYVKIGGNARTIAEKLQKKLYLSSQQLLPVVLLDISSTDQLLRAISTGDTLFRSEKQPSLVPTPAELTASAIQKRYDNTSTHCDNNQPAWHCSGLILRTTGPRYPFTTPPNTVVGSFSYLRSDTYTKNVWANAQGMIINPLDKTLEKKMKCIYPKDADTHSGHDRNPNAFYCNTQKSPAASLTDLSSCTSAGVVSTGGTPEQWSQNFQQKQYDGGTQCSFSVHDSKQFYAAILASRQNQNAGQTWNELIMSPMPDPNDVPDIEAFWYQVSKNNSNPAGKQIAQSYVSMYAALRHVKVPVVSFDMETKTFTLVE